MLSRFHGPYTFWLHDMESAPLAFPLKSKLAKCDVDVESIEINKGGGLFRIDLANIATCDPIFTGGRSPLRTGVQIEFGAPAERVLLVPANPLTPQDVFNMSAEVEALAEVINKLRAGDVPVVEPNPYHRQLLRKGKQEDIARRFWDPNVSPWVYFREDHARPSGHRIIGWIFLVLLALILLFVVLAAVFGGLEIVS